MLYPLKHLVKSSGYTQKMILKGLTIKYWCQYLELILGLYRKV